ncbi:hypothetical protein WP50_10955 [Lactiplantibacillus plantarum]|nr:hypothetical protein WP50_10955 [Lactiplantibacillus plantarum]
MIRINNFFWPHNPFNENQREYLFVELFRNVLSKDEYFKQAFISIIKHLYECDYDVDTGIFREMADKNHDYIEIYVKDQLGLLRTSKIVKRIHSQKEQPCYEIRINRNNEKPRVFFSTFIKPNGLSDCFGVWKGLLLCYGISKNGNMEVDTNDSWWTIAQRNGLSMTTLASQNGKSIYTTIYPSQRLVVR